MTSIGQVRRQSTSVMANRASRTLTLSRATRDNMEKTAQIPTLILICLTPLFYQGDQHIQLDIQLKQKECLYLYIDLFAS